MKLYGRGIWIFWEHESAFSYHGLTACAATIVMQLRRDQDMNTRVEHESEVYLVALVDSAQRLPVLMHWHSTLTNSGS